MSVDRARGVEGLECRALGRRVRFYSVEVSFFWLSSSVWRLDGLWLHGFPARLRGRGVQD